LNIEKWRHLKGMEREGGGRAYTGGTLECRGI